MNKKEFIKELQKELNCDENKAIIINNILEDNFFLSKKNKEKIINDLMKSLNTNEEEATSIYEEAIYIIKTSIKEKIKHPFKSK